MILLVGFLIFVFYLKLNFHFLIVLCCFRLQEEEALLLDNIHRQKDEIRKIADKVCCLLMLSNCVIILILSLVACKHIYIYGFDFNLN